MKQHLPLIHSLILAFLLALSLQVVQAQTPSAQRQGVSGKVLAAAELGNNFNIKNGRSLRMREVTIIPGGGLPMHSHADRPSVSYVLHGTLTEYREGDSDAQQIHPGEAFSTYGTVQHALENKGQVPVVFLEIDLP